MADPWATLGVSRSATQDEVRWTAACRRSPPTTALRSSPRRCAASMLDALSPSLTFR